MTTLEEVKNYLRVDFELEDALIKTAISTARSYLIFAVDDLEEKEKASRHFYQLANHAQLLIAVHYYTMRDQGTDAGFPMFLRAIITQLQHYTLTAADIPPTEQAPEATDDTEEMETIEAAEEGVPP